MEDAVRSAGVVEPIDHSKEGVRPLVVLPPVVPEQDGRSAVTDAGCAGQLLLRVRRPTTIGEGASGAWMQDGADGGAAST